MQSITEFYVQTIKLLGIHQPEEWVENMKNLGIDLLYSGFYIFLGYVGIRFGKRIIKNIFTVRETERRFQLSARKVQTLAPLLVSILRYSIYFFVIMNILERFNVNTRSILTVAGIGGVAIGFGAQNLVKDIITGFFILLEDQFSVGDLITVNGMSGTVEEMGLRVTKLRDYDGALYIIPNSAIGTVTNRSKGIQKAIVDISVAYEENISQVTEIMKEVLEELSNGHEDILSPAQILGVQSLGASEVVIRAVAECKVGTQWAVGREMRKVIKEKFDQLDIEIPYRKIVFIQQGQIDDQWKKEGK